MSGQGDTEVAKYHAQDPRYGGTEAAAGKHPIVLPDDVADKPVSSTTTTVPDASATSSRQVSDKRPQVVNDRKLEGPYRTKAESKAVPRTVSGNTSEVSLISDFDADSSPVRDIVQSVTGVMGLPDLSSSRTHKDQITAPMMPIPLQKSDKIPIASIQEPDQSDAASSPANSASDDETDKKVTAVFRTAEGARLPWGIKNLTKMAVARPHANAESLWNRLVGDEVPSAHLAITFLQAIKTARWTHKRAIDAVSSRISKLY